MTLKKTASKSHWKCKKNALNCESSSQNWVRYKGKKKLEIAQYLSKIKHILITFCAQHCWISYHNLDTFKMQTRPLLMSHLYLFMSHFAISQFEAKTLVCFLNFQHNQQIKNLENLRYSASNFEAHGSLLRDWVEGGCWRFTVPRHQGINK